MSTVVFSNPIPEDWERTTLGEVVRRGKGSIQTGPFGSQLHASDYVPVGVPTIMPVNIGENRIVETGIARITEADADRLSKHRVQVGDIIYSRRGDVERRALIRKEQEGWLCGTGCLKVRLGKGVSDPLYASFYLGHPEVRAWIVQHAVGATMPNLNTSIMESVPFLLPPLREQQAIACILGALDDKIELNRRRNQTLEAMARAIFQSWFVDFDPVKAKAAGRTPPGLSPELAALFPDRFEDSPLGPIPAGWRVGKIGDFIQRIPVGKKYEQKTVCPVGSIPVLDQGKSGIIGYHNDTPGVNATLDQPVAVFANHTCYMRLIIYPFSAIQNVLPFVGVDVDTVWAFYATEGRLSFSEYKGHWPEFVVQDLVAPQLTLTRAFGHLINPLVGRIHKNEEESRTLAALRDALLPKLISGELRVPDAERIVGRAT